MLQSLGIKRTDELDRALQVLPPRIIPYALFGFQQEENDNYVPVRPQGPGKRLASQSLNLTPQKAEEVKQQIKSFPSVPQAPSTFDVVVKQQSNFSAPQTTLKQHTVQQYKPSESHLSQKLSSQAADSPIQPAIKYFTSPPAQKIVSPTVQNVCPRKDDPRYKKYFDLIASGKKPVFVIAQIRAEIKGFKGQLDFFTRPNEPYNE